MRRWIAIGAAVILAVVGTLLLISYVQGAEDRAREGQDLATVIVVEDLVERGTLATEIIDSVRQVEVPVGVVATGAVSDLTELEGLVAEVDLVPGEQVIASRFQSPAALAAESRVEVPAEFLQLSLSLEPERVVGGRLVPGDRVAFVASFEPFDLAAVEPGDEEALEEAQDQIVVITDEEGNPVPTNLSTPTSTKIVIHKVLVTGVQLENEPRATTSEDGLTSTVEYAPTGNLVVTMAATAEDAEKIVFTAEFGTIWLALEDADAPEPDTDIRTRANIYL